MQVINIRKVKIKTWSILLVIAALITYYANTGLDPYWHIKIGEWISVNHKVPTTGIFMYSNLDMPWISHEWLSSLFLYTIYHYTGWAGLIFSTLICLLASILLLMRFLLKRLPVVHCRILVLFAILLLIQHILPRPHMFALPIIIYWTSQLIEASEKQLSPPFNMLPLMIIWANIHGSFLAGIVFCIFWGAESVFYAQENVRKELVYKWFIFVLASFLCATVSPHGINGLLLPLQISNMNVALSYIGEWRSPNFQNIQALEVWLLILFAVVLTKGIKLPVFRIAFLLGLIHLSLKHTRYSSDLLSVLAPLIIATPLSKQLNLKPEVSLTDLFPKSGKALSVIGVYFLALFFYLAEIKVIESEDSLKIQKVLNTLKPEQASLGNVLNEYGFGAYLIYLGFPSFIDGRAEIYGDKFLEDYLNIIALAENPEKVEKFLKKYHVSWTLFSKKVPINAILYLKPEWHSIYEDKNIIIYLHESVKLSEKTVDDLSKIQEINIDDPV